MILEVVAHLPYPARVLLLTAGLIALPLSIQACRGGEPEVDVSETERELTVYELGRVGGRVYNEPERTEQILEEVGMTPLEFEQRVRGITNDPEQSSEYTRGFEEVARPAPKAPPAPTDSAPVPDTTQPPG
jgi:hypothetical protein